LELKSIFYNRYWDWTLDSSDPSHSPIWDPETGFGGNGSPRQYTGSGRRVGVQMRLRRPLD